MTPDLIVATPDPVVTDETAADDMAEARPEEVPAPSPAQPDSALAGAEIAAVAVEAVDSPTDAVATSPEMASAAIAE
eukprot:4368401-Amphidinium_carterae.1